jgi:hypothetical protein
MNVHHHPPMPPQPAPPAPPRAITQGVLRRSLMEPTVRFWWAAGLALGAVALYFLISRMVTWSQELYVIRHGDAVAATVTSMGEGEIQGHFLSPDYPVTLDFTYRGQPYEVAGLLEGRTDPIAMKDSVQIKVDPNDPYHWTYRTDAPPIMHALLASLLVLPFALAALIVAFVHRRRVLRTWTTGTAAQFIVEAIGHSSLAPGSWHLRCKAADGRTTRLVHIFLPRHFGHPRPGDVLWLIHPPGQPRAAVPAMAYG